MQKYYFFLVFNIFFFFALFSQVPPPPPPNAVQTQEPSRPVPPLQPNSKTEILPGGIVQIAPGSYFTPLSAYDANGNTLPVKQTMANKYDTTFPISYIAKGVQSQLAHTQVSHPGGGMLPGGIGGSLDSFLANIKQTPGFLPYFQKIKILVLQNIYAYLMKVYTNFNMQHPATLKDYVTQESQYGVNKKTLVINHLVNVIEAQTNGYITQIFPGITKDKASWTGNFLMQHDCTDLNSLLIDIEKNVYLSAIDKQIISDQRKAYFSLLSQYLELMKQYGALLDTIDPSTGFTQLVAVAQEASKEIEAFTAPLRNALVQAQGKTVTTSIPLKDNASKSFALNAKVSALRSAKDAGSYLSPGIFFYDEDTFRGIKLLPDLARRIGEESFQKMGWPSQIVADAKNATPAQYNTAAIVGISEGTNLGYPIAYFKNADGSPTTSETGRLFVNMPNGNITMHTYNPNNSSQPPQSMTVSSLHEQELLKEPDWLNTQDGILKILKGCLGDFSQLIGMGILDPCNEALLLKANNPVQAPTTVSGWQNCQNYLNTIDSARVLYSKNNPPQTTSSPE